jgi:hypothetical protein
MFNDDQRAHMRALAATPPERLAWCGWFRVDEVGPTDLTAADKLRMRCEACGNEPWIDNGGRLVHLAGCTAEFRREHHASFDLGGES